AYKAAALPTELHQPVAHRRPPKPWRGTGSARIAAACELHSNRRHRVHGRRKGAGPLPSAGSEVKHFHVVFFTPEGASLSGRAPARERGGVPPPKPPGNGPA